MVTPKIVGFTDHIHNNKATFKFLFASPKKEYKNSHIWQRGGQNCSVFRALPEEAT